MLRTILLSALLVLSTLTASAQPKAEAVTSKGGVVACVSPPAADAGLNALKSGGNAVDAAVATAFAMAVTWPEAGNIGGGGFMMVAAPGKEPTCIEYRETAPAAAKVDLLASGYAGFGAARIVYDTGSREPARRSEVRRHSLPDSGPAIRPEDCPVTGPRSPRDSTRFRRAGECSPGAGRPVRRTRRQA